MKITFHKPLTCGWVTDMLSQFLFEELSKEDQGRLQGHLLDCESCSMKYFDLIEGSLESGRLPMPRIPAPPHIPTLRNSTHLSELRGKPAPGIDNAGDEAIEPLLTFQVSFTRLAAAPRKLERRSVSISDRPDKNFVQIEKDGFIITLWEIEEENQTLVGAKITSGLRQTYEGKRLLIKDADNKKLLGGRFSGGEISDESEVRLQEIKSPLEISVFA